MALLSLVKSYDEVGNIRTFVFGADQSTWKAGQYQTYEFPEIAGKKDDRVHYFTIASAPIEDEIHISTRITDSAFKQTLNAMKPGDTIEARNIDGDFTWEGTEPVVLVAAGIGVTPYRSMFVERDKTGQPLSAHLLYYGRDDDFAFRDEFDRLVGRHPELRIDYIIGDRITTDSIISRAPEAMNQVTYLSGPEPMVEMVGEDMKSRNMNIKQDWFPGYTDDTY